MRQRPASRPDFPNMASRGGGGGWKNEPPPPYLEDMDHLEDRLGQVHVWASYTHPPLFWGYSCSIPQSMIWCVQPLEFLHLNPLRPLPRCHFFRGMGGGRGGGGSKFPFILWPLCVDLDPGPEQLFLVHGPPNQWRGHGSKLQVPLYGPLPLRTLPFSGWHASGENHLAKVVGSKPCRPTFLGERRIHHPPLFGPIPVPYPQGVELLIVKSLFCPINASPNELLVPPPPFPSPHLKPIWGRGGGGGAVKEC